MDLYVEKEFAENFVIEYYPDKGSEIQKIIYSIFSEYPGINWYLNTSEDFIVENELLYKLSDYNQNFELNVDFNKLFNSQFTPKNQTIVLTEKYRSWFPLLIEKGVLCFSYDDYEIEIQNFIDKTHFKIDLSAQENIPFKWNRFNFLNKQTNFIIISDHHILCDKDGQKIGKNLIPLLKENLNKNHSYSIFIFTELAEDFEKKRGQLNSALNGYHAKIHLFNFLPEFENIDFHDRILYSNYTITDSGKGFNLNSSKLKNSQIVNASIFEKYTFKRFNIHLKELERYICKLEKLEHGNNPVRASKKDFDAFRKLAANF